MQVGNHRCSSHPFSPWGWCVEETQLSPMSLQLLVEATQHCSCRAVSSSVQCSTGGSFCHPKPLLGDTGITGIPAAQLCPAAPPGCRGPGQGMCVPASPAAFPAVSSLLGAPKQNAAREPSQTAFGYLVFSKEKLKQRSVFLWFCYFSFGPIFPFFFFLLLC